MTESPRPVPADTPPAKPPTLADVAEAAGVSLITASRILNPGVRGALSGSEERRRRVDAAARSLGYVVNPAAQAIALGAAKTIALIVSDIRDFGSATILAGVMSAAESRGMSVAARTTHDRPDREIQIVRKLRGERHRGVIVATSRTTDEVREAALGRELQTLEASGTRVVVIGDSTLPFSRVTVDTEAAAATLAAGLAPDYRRIVILAGPEDEVTSQERVAGFQTGLRAAGSSTAEVVHSQFSRDGGYAAARTILEQNPDLELIAAMSDAMAVGAIAAANERGLRVPDDLAVSGFDNVPLIADLLPGFSTVSMPLERFGEACLHLIIDGKGEAETAQLRANVLIRVPPRLPNQ